MKVIGQHFEFTGILELWSESKLLGIKTAEKVLAGKDYKRGMRAHKITFQALLELLIPQIMHYIDQTNHDLKRKIEEAEREGNDLSRVTILSSVQFHEALHGFIAAKGQNPNFALWYSYLQMISILLLFTRANRDLHLCAFRMMLPYFHRYSHYNYAKWGSVYLAEMHMLPSQLFISRVSKKCPI